MGYKLEWTTEAPLQLHNSNFDDRTNRTLFVPVVGTTSGTTHACGLIIVAVYTVSGTPDIVGITNNCLDMNGGGGSVSLSSAKFYSTVRKSYAFYSGTGVLLDYIAYSDWSFDSSVGFYTTTCNKDGNRFYKHTNYSTPIRSLIYVDPYEYIYSDNGLTGTFSTTLYPVYKDSSGIYHANTGASLTNVTLLSPLSDHFRSQSVDIFHNYNLRAKNSGPGVVTWSAQTKMRKYGTVEHYRGYYQLPDIDSSRVHQPLYVLQPNTTLSDHTPHESAHYYDLNIMDFGISDFEPTKVRPVVLTSGTGVPSPGLSLCWVDEYVLYQGGRLYGIPKNYKVDILVRQGGTINYDTTRGTTIYGIAYTDIQTIFVPTVVFGPAIDNSAYLHLWAAKSDTSLDGWHFYFTATSSISWGNIARNNSYQSIGISAYEATTRGFDSATQKTVSYRDAIRGVNGGTEVDTRQAEIEGKIAHEVILPMTAHLTVSYQTFYNETASKGVVVEPLTSNSSYITRQYDASQGYYLKLNGGNTSLVDTGTIEFSAGRTSMATQSAILILKYKVYTELDGLIRTNAKDHVRLNQYNDDTMPSYSDTLDGYLAAGNNKLSLWGVNMFANSTSQHAFASNKYWIVMYKA